jgi:hypothetical protein
MGVDHFLLLYGEAHQKKFEISRSSRKIHGFAVGIWKWLGKHVHNAFNIIQHIPKIYQNYGFLLKSAKTRALREKRSSIFRKYPQSPVEKKH